jgi:uncharacterized protein (TIGR02145 family)
MILTHGANSIVRGGGDFVEIGGRKYPVVKIGNQLWMAENLDYKWNGLDITSTLQTTQAASYYDNDEATYGIDGTYKCGLLYNWYAVKYLNDNKSTLLPDGWHVPTLAEYDTLALSVGSNPGTKLKAFDNSVTSTWPSNWKGTDEYGFAMLPGGLWLEIYQDFGGTGAYGTIDGSGNNRNYKEVTTGASLIGAYTHKKYGTSIRLVKDAT